MTTLGALPEKVCSTQDDYPNAIHLALMLVIGPPCSISQVALEFRLEQELFFRLLPVARP
jgi:hypothetical protein